MRWVCKRLRRGRGNCFQTRLVFRWAIDNVRETDAEMNKAQYLLATGQLDNPAEVTMANTKAAAAVDLLVQLRNKAVEAYSELMRISL